MPYVAKVFISATSRGLRSARQAVAERIRARGHEPVVQEEFPTDYQQIRHMLRDRLAPCDAVVCLVGPAYGFEATDWPAHLPRRSYTQLEYDVAVELRKPVYRLIAADTYPLDPFAPEPPEHQQRQRDHLAKLKDSDFVWYTFATRDDLLGHTEHIPLQRRVPVRLPFESLGDLFKGRDEFVRTVRQALLTRPAHAAAVTTRQAIHGLGGVGKTRLAIEYAYRYATEYPAVLFVTADTPFNFRSNLANLCRAEVLDLPEKDEKEQEVQVQAVLRWLRQHAGWLLILDNVDTPEAQAAVRTALGDTANGHVLITSRRSEMWAADVTTIELDTLSIPAATEFLLDRTKPNPDAPTTPHRRMTPTDDAEATGLAEELGGLALALEQAGAYVAVNRVTFAEYRARLRDVEREVLTWFDETAMSYPRSVAVTWQASVNQLYDDGRAMLNLVAWLAPDPIPVDMLRAEPPAEDGAGPAIRNRERAIADLAAYSLAKWSTDGAAITVHRLVQDVIRLHTPETERRGSIEAALWMLSRFAPDPQDSRNWGTWASITPHAAAVIPHAEDVGGPGPTTFVMNQLANHLQVKAAYPEAESLCRRILSIEESRSDSDRTSLAMALNNLAEVLRNSNRPREAEPLYRRAIPTLERSSDRTLYAICLNNLANVLRDTDRLAEAEPLYHQALVTLEETHGRTDPQVAVCLNNLALLLSMGNRLVEAERLYRRALDIDEAQTPPDLVKVARRLVSLSNLLRLMGRHAEAETLCRRGLAIDEAIYPPDHPDVAVSLSNLFNILFEMQRCAEAEAVCRRALAIDQSQKPLNAVTVARRQNNLGILLSTLGQHVEAESLLRQALTVWEVNHGPHHPEVALALSNLGALLSETGRYSEAEPLLRRSLSIWEKSYSAFHPKVASDLKHLAQLLAASKRPGEAEVLYRRALAIDERNLGPGDPAVATDLNNLASILQATGAYPEAEALYRRAIMVYETIHGPNHPDVSNTLDNLAGLLQNSGRSTEAEALCRRSVEVDEAHYGSDNPMVAIRLYHLAQLLSEKGQYEEAESLFRRALPLAIRGFGIDHLVSQSTLKGYSLLLAARRFTTEEGVARMLEVLTEARG